LNPRLLRCENVAARAADLGLREIDVSWQRIRVTVRDRWRPFETAQCGALVVRVLQLRRLRGQGCDFVGIDPVVTPVVALRRDLAVADRKEDHVARHAGAAHRVRHLHTLGHATTLPIGGAAAASASTHKTCATSDSVNRNSTSSTDGGYVPIQRIDPRRDDVQATEAPRNPGRFTQVRQPRADGTEPQRLRPRASLFFDRRDPTMVNWLNDRKDVAADR
jgi:hypothetical protein